MNRELRRRAAKIVRRKKSRTSGAFGNHKAVRAWNEKKKKTIKTFTRYMKEGKDQALLKKRKAFLSVV